MLAPLWAQAKKVIIPPQPAIRVCAARLFPPEKGMVKIDRAAPDRPRKEYSGNI
jgi:hypothetical protein